MVRGKLIDFIYPKEQRMEEEGNLAMNIKRIEKLHTLTQALYAESKVLGLI